MSTTSKKGELLEWSNYLNGNHLPTKRDTMKAVISAMTVGRDVSSIFSDVVKCIVTKDPELKKLVYLYLIHHAKEHPDTSILAVNAFVIDSKNKESSLVRALAIRTMGCIKVPTIIEYLADPVSNGTRDTDPYVRKVSALTIAKMFAINPEVCSSQNFLGHLRNLASDSNPMVISNAVAALTDIARSNVMVPVISDDGREAPLCIAAQNILKEPSLVRGILATIQNASEWGIIQLLDALSFYIPMDADDAIAAMEGLGSKLQHANPAVVGLCIKAIMHFVRYVHPSEAQKFMNRCVPSLITLLSNDSPEIQYIALRCIPPIAAGCPQMLSAVDIRPFLPKYHDTLYVKMEKLDVLLAFCNETNYPVIVRELTEAAAEVDATFVRKAIHTIGLIALKLPSAAPVCVNSLVTLVKSNRSDSEGGAQEDRVTLGNIQAQTQISSLGGLSGSGYSIIVQESLIALKDIVRCYPRRFDGATIPVLSAIDSVDNPNAMEALLFILSEFADAVENVDEIFEGLTETFMDEPEAVQLAMITASVKAFLAQPTAAMQAIVMGVLSKATGANNNSGADAPKLLSPDVRERGYFYWRLLSVQDEGNQTPFQAAKEIIFAQHECKVINGAEMSVVVKPDDAFSYMIPAFGQYSCIAHRHPCSIFPKNVSINTLIRNTLAEVARVEAEEQAEEAGDINVNNADLTEVSAKQPTSASLIDLDDLLSPVSAAPKPVATAPVATQAANTVQQAAPQGLDALLTQPQPAQVATQQQQQINLIQVLSPDKGNGLAAKVAFSPDFRTLYMVFANTLAQAVEVKLIQFNKNEKGLVPVGPEVNCPTIQPSSTSPMVAVQLTANQTYENATVSPGIVQVALQTSVGVVYFAASF